VGPNQASTRAPSGATSDWHTHRACHAPSCPVGGRARRPRGRPRAAGRRGLGLGVFVCVTEEKGDTGHVSCLPAATVGFRHRWQSNASTAGRTRVVRDGAAGPTVRCPRRRTGQALRGVTGPLCRSRRSCAARRRGVIQRRRAPFAAPFAAGPGRRRSLATRVSKVAKPTLGAAVTRSGEVKACKDLRGVLPSPALSGSGDLGVAFRSLDLPASQPFGSLARPAGPLSNIPRRRDGGKGTRSLFGPQFGPCFRPSPTPGCLAELGLGVRAAGPPARGR
jgi:hypothetical protein